MKLRKKTSEKDDWDENEGKETEKMIVVKKIETSKRILWRKEKDETDKDK